MLCSHTGCETLLCCHSTLRPFHMCVFAVAVSTQPFVYGKLLHIMQPLCHWDSPPPAVLRQTPLLVSGFWCENSHQLSAAQEHPFLCHPPASAFNTQHTHRHLAIREVTQREIEFCVVIWWMQSGSYERKQKAEGRKREVDLKSWK